MKTAEEILREFVVQWGQEGIYDKVLDKSVRTLIESALAERMPTEEEAKKAFEEVYFVYRPLTLWMECYKWFRSRMEESK
jgi:hypothetical protein